MSSKLDSIASIWRLSTQFKINSHIPKCSGILSFRSHLIEVEHIHLQSMFMCFHLSRCCYFRSFSIAHFSLDLSNSPTLFCMLAINWADVRLLKYLSFNHPSSLLLLGMSSFSANLCSVQCTSLPLFFVLLFCHFIFRHLLGFLFNFHTLHSHSFSLCWKSWTFWQSYRNPNCNLNICYHRQ